MLNPKHLLNLGVFCWVLCTVASSAQAASSIVKTQKTPKGWELLVNGQPFFIRGMCYFPDTIGESSDDNTRRNWEMVDDDKDGRNDFAFQSWVDANRNNRRDTNEKDIGDFELMKEMGVNVVRIYHHVSDDSTLLVLNKTADKILNFPAEKEKKILRELYSKFGIMSAMGDFLGAYTVATGATWDAGTDYTDPVQRANMLRSVKDMVLAYKDEPYLLMWILGNENNLPYPHTNASLQPEAYARFVNEAAKLIKQLDKHRHPVALCNGGDQLLQVYAKFAPEVDIFGLNLYVNNSYYELWKKVGQIYDRPVMLTEFGTGYPLVVKGQLDEERQAEVHRNAWTDIYRHRAGQEPPGNAIGGFVFAWVDDWWEDGDQWHQNINPDGSGWNHEYNGMASHGDGTAGSLSRQLRKVYRMYQEMWEKEAIEK